jgi:hypothetical protein
MDEWSTNSEQARMSRFAELCDISRFAELRDIMLCR